ncbi:hypothetical protein DFH09DRAFT_1109818 [Mycena vulgaris]|nr:hypothetical protein DFH09DRAFT_1109818 [Mycena vulgaris]
MSTSSSPSRVSGQTVPGKATFRLFKPSSQARSNWLSTSLLTAKAITAGAEFLPFPYVKGIFGMVVAILKTVEKVKKNRDDLKELCGNIMDIIRIVENQISTHGDTAAVKIKGPCEDLHGLSSRLKEVVKLSSTADELAGYRTRIQELRLNFILMAAMDTNMQVHNLRFPSDVVATPATQTITKDLDEQHIYLLYGLGGAGKTQIALKFIEESSWFSDIFLIDNQLRVYAGSHSQVSDMEEPDAVALLLKSGVQDVTTRNLELANEIVKALYYLPLAIIQAGAFISKSGGPFKLFKPLC